MEKPIKELGISHWYPTLADYTFPTTFVQLKEEDLELIVNKVTEGPAAEAIIARINNAQNAFPGRTFVFADTAAPTDTERFLIKKGAVHSALSAWKNLLESEKIRNAAVRKDFECICIRPFRNLTYPREFRLFIVNGKLKLMSQYWQTRHYERLVDKKELYWKKAVDFVDEISWLLPEPTIVLDIYFTSKDQIILIDFNPWGEPTRPLLSGSWDIDWSVEHGIRIL